MTYSPAALRSAETERLVALIFDYLVENGIFGDVHVYGCDRGEFLPTALRLAGEGAVPAAVRFFGFASFVPPPPVEGRGYRRNCSFEQPVAADRFTGKGADPRLRIVAGPYDQTLSRASRDRFMNEENKIAVACLRARTQPEARQLLEFVEPLLTEGSVVVLEDLFAGYRRTAAKEVGRAFLEHAARGRYHYARFLDAGWWGRCYIAALPGELPLSAL